jgi:SnoaL-like domain
MAKSREQLVDEMLDCEAIKDLPARYCHYVWSKNLEGVLSLFTEDGLFSSGGRGPLARSQGTGGPAQVLRQRARSRRRATVHPQYRD